MCWHAPQVFQDLPYAGSGGELLIEGVAAVCELDVHIQLHQTANLHGDDVKPQLMIMNTMTALPTGIRCVHNEDEEEEEDYQLWPAVMLAVMLSSHRNPYMLSNKCREGRKPGAETHGRLVNAALMLKGPACA